MNEKFKKIIDKSMKVISWILVAFTVFIMLFTIITVTTVDKNERSIFGHKFYIVQTDSMSKSENNADMDVHFNAGDIVVIKNLDDKEKYQLKAGDVISFMSTNADSYGETITHMIYEVKRSDTGSFEGYRTYGTNTGAIDSATVTPEYILGQYTGKLPGVGNFFAFVKSTPGYIVCILIPFLLLILYNGSGVIRLFRKYKKEQTAAIDAEKKQLEEERAENQHMMAELLELKAQLTKQAEEKSSTEQSSSENTDEQ